MDMILGVTGASGVIGRHVIAAATAAGHQVVAFSRRPTAPWPGVTEVRPWDPSARRPDLTGLHAVIHLAGEPVTGRWTARKRAAILHSRVEGTRAVVQALAALAPPAATLVCASGVGYYGDRGDEPLTETAAPGTGFLAEVAQAWEAEAIAAETHGARVVRARLGMVLSPQGGAWPALRRIFRLGLGGRLGSGRQWISWIHADDAAALLVAAATDARYAGALHLTAPAPVPQREFARGLARALRRPALLPAPALGLRLLLGRQASFLLDGQRALPAAAQEAGFAFRFPTLEAALAELTRQRAT